MSRFRPARPEYWGEHPHLVTVIKTPMGHQCRCQCGWSRMVRRQNALARAAKVGGAVREHLRSVSPVTPPPKPRE